MLRKFAEEDVPSGFTSRRITPVTVADVPLSGILKCFIVRGRSDDGHEKLCGANWNDGTNTELEL